MGKLTREMKIARLFFLLPLDSLDLTKIPFGFGFNVYTSIPFRPMKLCLSSEKCQIKYHKKWLLQYYITKAKKFSMEYEKPFSLHQMLFPFSIIISYVFIFRNSSSNKVWNEITRRCLRLRLRISIFVEIEKKSNFNFPP